MEPLVDLPLLLPPAGSRRRLAALHRALQAAIGDGRLQPGLRLPATRRLAAALGLSRNTVLAAYDLLLSEGYVEARRGSGTYVGRIARQPRAASGGGLSRRLAPAWRARRPLAEPAPGGAYAFDLRLGSPEKALFPHALWRRLSNRAGRALARSPAAYGGPEGRAGLRAAIARHVSFTRAVACTVDDIVVTAGAQQAFDLLARILVTPGKTLVAVEDPGYPPLRAAFAAAGAALAPVPVDGEGLVVERLPRRARVVCVTPSHQFPLGVVLSPARRAQLIDWARSRDAVLVEDDYDSEFRYGGRALDALQTLDRDGRVVYVGTFSKCLFPVLRLGYVVAPPWARPALLAARQASDWHGDPLPQDTLASFIDEGHLARHLRRMRRLYDARRSLLLQGLSRLDWLQPLPSAAGLHLAARLHGRLSGTVLARRAAEAGIAVEALERYAVRQPAAWCGLAFGFGTIAAERIEAAIAGLARLG